MKDNELGLLCLIEALSTSPSFPFPSFLFVSLPAQPSYALSLSLAPFPISVSFLSSHHFLFFFFSFFPSFFPSPLPLSFSFLLCPFIHPFFRSSFFLGG